MFAKGTPISTSRTTLSASRPSRHSLSVICGESRIGRLPVPIPAGVEYNFTGQHLKVKGPLGELEHVFSDDIAFTEKDGNILISRVSDRRESKAMHGLARALCNNMFVGVSKGYEKILIMNGVGYRAAVEGEILNMSVGFCHPVLLDIPKGIKVKVHAKSHPPSPRLLIGGREY